KGSVRAVVRGGGMPWGGRCGCRGSRPATSTALQLRRSPGHPRRSCLPFPCVDTPGTRHYLLAWLLTVSQSPELPSRFGPYQIVGPLSAGGMGQVFRARDTRLQRFVAIKSLHDAAAASADRQRRFAQEALAASALNHPNILTVYDVGAEGDIQYLVSELIEGEPLRGEMNRGRL